MDIPPELREAIEHVLHLGFDAARRYIENAVQAGETRDSLAASWLVLAMMRRSLAAHRNDLSNQKLRGLAPTPTDVLAILRRMQILLADHRATLKKSKQSETDKANRTIELHVQRLLAEPQGSPTNFSALHPLPAELKAAFATIGLEHEMMGVLLSKEIV